MSSPDGQDVAGALRGPLILWSPPRCRSTAFLRMMAARGDFQVVHEPFSHLMDFGAADVAGVRCTDEQAVMTALLELSARTPVFVKDTTDFHYPGLLAAEEFLRAATHSIIIRHPREVIASHYRINPELTCEEVGFERVREIYQAAEKAGNPPVIIDADDLVDHPEATVRSYCTAVGIPLRLEALAWTPETLPQWQRTLRWHAEVAESTGFARSNGHTAQVDAERHPRLATFYRHHLPHYEWLRDRRLSIGEG